MERFSDDIVESIEDTLLSQLPDILGYALEKANEDGKLRELMKLLCLERMLPQSNRIESLPTGKILVFGRQEVSKNVMEAIAKDLGISKQRFEFYDYEEAKTYPYNHLDSNGAVCAVLFGAVPHKTTGTGDAGSVISNLEQRQQEGIIPARILQLSAGGELKITKTNFRNTLVVLVDTGIVRPDLWSSSA